MRPLKCSEEFLTRNISEILCFFLILMIVTRLGNTYFSPNGRLRAPEMNFASGTLGHDNDFSVAAWNILSHGKTPFIFGYGSVLLAAAGISYRIIVGLSLIGLFVLLLLSVKEKRVRIPALIIFGIFLLGVPANKAIEAGNADLFLSVLFGAILLLLRNRLQNTRHSYLRSTVLGILLGFVLNVKGFLVLFVLAALLFSGWDIPLIIWFILSFAATALWPWFYGVKSRIFDVFFAAAGLTQIDMPTMLTQLHYGNNALLPYVSNIVFAWDQGKIATNLHRIYTIAGAGVLALFIYVKPLFDEKFTLSARLIQRSRGLFSFWKKAFYFCCG